MISVHECEHFTFFKRSLRQWKDNIKIALTQLIFEYVDKIRIAQFWVLKLGFCEKGSKMIGF